MFIVSILFSQFGLALSYALSEWSPNYGGAIILARNREQDRTSIDPKFIT